MHINDVEKIMYLVMGYEYKNKTQLKNELLDIYTAMAKVIKFSQEKEHEECISKKHEKVIEIYSKELSVDEAIKETGYSSTTIKNILRKNNIKIMGGYIAYNHNIRNARIFYDRLCNGESYISLGISFDISASRVRQIFIKLRRYFSNNPDGFKKRYMSLLPESKRKRLIAFLES